MADSKTNGATIIERRTDILPADELLKLVRDHANVKAKSKQTWGWEHLANVKDAQIMGVLMNGETQRVFTRHGALSEVWKRLIKAKYEASPASNAVKRATLVNGKVVK